MNAYANWLASRSGNMATLIEAMKKEGWVPVTPERQPYRIDLCPQIMSGLAAAGFTKIETPVFKVGDRIYNARTRRMKVEFDATDKPEDLPNVNAQLLPLVIEHLRESQSTHILSVVVTRSALFGYLPPKVGVFTCSAKVSLILLNKEMYEGFGFGQPDTDHLRGQNLGIGPTARRFA